MAKLINGNGNPAIYAAEDADWFAAIMGNQTSITGIGEQFRADQADANTIEVFDGVIITKEGRRIQLDANAVDLFEIPTGVPGTTSYYIIGYHLYNDENSNQFCEVFTQKMDTSSETIPEDTFRGGADEVFVSLYRVTQDGLTITDIDLLLQKITNITQINGDLSANSKHFYFDYQNGKYGYNTDPSRGAGTFSPFRGEPNYYDSSYFYKAQTLYAETVSGSINVSCAAGDIIKIYIPSTINGGNNPQDGTINISVSGATVIQGSTGSSSVGWGLQSLRILKVRATSTTVTISGTMGYTGDREAFRIIAIKL